jgi:type I site-specific restriction endonuclease
LGTRTVSVTIDNTREDLQYAGVTNQRLENDDLVKQTWVPLGTAPTYADDDALVDAWHTALRWSHAHTQA